MGMKLFSDSPLLPRTQPDPRRFDIEYAHIMGPYAVLVVRYPDATTFEGRKVLVYRDSLQNLKARKELDPHFSEDSTGPIARFEPTTLGKEMAHAFVALLAGRS